MCNLFIIFSKKIGRVYSTFLKKINFINSTVKFTKIEKNHNYSKYKIYIELNKSPLEIENYLKNIKYPKQIAILTSLLNGNSIEKNKENSGTIKTLVNKNLVKEVKKQVYRLNYDNTKLEIKPKMSLEQEKAVTSVDMDQFLVYLLYGITGSGKTEVYMNLIEKASFKGKSSLLLVPEISLTTQMIERIYKRFGFKNSM